ncbi:MAG: L-fucose:H+ symporter permease [Bacteroidaceae bacterium]|nr:L-fucose:H+ symporter permease [Bacteroidaceae bacterium]MBR4337765.1 L-fucose:H+ symporter permease [Bacteroidaceae bacterium]
MKKPAVVSKQFLLPFVLVTSLFFFWGIANNMTDTLLAAFKRIMSMTDTQTSLIQFSFYGAYAVLALPAALFIRRFSYKSGIVLGLFMYALGAILFLPASKAASYAFYLGAIFILAGGCSILETTANPYILSMGAPETATRRLNVAQAFNPLGSITGILLSTFFIQAELNSADATARAAMSEAQLEAIQAHELGAVTGTYMTLGFVLLAVLVIMLLSHMPKTDKASAASPADASPRPGSTLRRLAANKRYWMGVVAQFFYVGAQIGVWSFTIRLAMSELGIREQAGSVIYLVSIIGFSASRFVFTWLMKYFRPSRLLVVAAVADIVLSLAVVLTQGMGWLPVCALIAISLFMSLMFPTIYGIALDGIGDDAKIGASGLIMAILGGALLTPLQAVISDATSINTSYLVPAFCFLVVLLYGLYVEKHRHTA